MPYPKRRIPASRYMVDTWDWLPDDYGSELPGGPIDPRADPEALFAGYTTGCGNIVRVKGCSPETAPPRPKRGFDFVFIDGDHLSPGFDRDVEFYFKNLAAGGILMGDDYDPINWPDIVRFLGKFSKQTRCIVERRGDKLWEICCHDPLHNGDAAEFCRRRANVIVSSARAIPSAGLNAAAMALG